MSFGCSHGRNRPAERRFCSSTFGAVGPEFTHVFPWRIYDCLRREGIEPRIETSSQYTGLVGRRRIVRLRAGWSDGSRLDIKYEGTGDFGSEPEYRGYYGIYKMVVWLPSKSS